MPISSYSVIPDVMCEVIHRNPRRVLDVGIGNGIYGALVRNYLERVEITGIEGFRGYKNLLWGSYDEVLIQTVPRELNIEGKFDVIIITDVIEHLTKEEGRELIERLKAHLNGIMLITTPAIFCPQGAVGGNELEIHKTLWTPEDLPEFQSLRSGDIDKYGHMMYCFKFLNQPK